MVFCRVDGSPLVVESGAVSETAGTEVQMKNRFLLALAVVLSLSVSTSAQQPNASQQPSPSPTPQPSVTTQQPPPVSEEDVVRITTNLVQVDAVITDKNGKPVTDLKPEEIQIFEDGTL